MINAVASTPLLSILSLKFLMHGRPRGGAKPHFVTEACAPITSVLLCDSARACSTFVPPPGPAVYAEIGLAGPSLISRGSLVFASASQETALISPPTSAAAGEVSRCTNRRAQCEWASLLVHISVCYNFWGTSGDKEITSGLVN